MELVIMRHGHAEAMARSDEERALTSRGRDGVACVAAVLARMGLTPTMLVASPFRRAQETASLVAREFENMPIVTEELLVPEARTSDLLTSLPRETDCLFLVSHMPLVSEILGQMLCGSAQSSLPLSPACAVWLDIAHPASRDGSIRAAITPRIAEALLEGDERPQG